MDKKKCKYKTITIITVSMILNLYNLLCSRCKILENKREILRQKCTDSRAFSRGNPKLMSAPLEQLFKAEKCTHAAYIIRVWWFINECFRSENFGRKLTHDKLMFAFKRVFVWAVMSELNSEWLTVPKVKVRSVLDV